jgi:hypothetical protein
MAMITFLHSKLQWFLQTVNSTLAYQEDLIILNHKVRLLALPTY